MRFLPVLPSLAAFLLMVTALTYQFQGWLSSLMTNPRRRRSVIMVTTAIIIVLSQLPNLVNVFAPWERNPQAKPSVTISIAARGRTARLVNMAVPVGWLPLGVMHAAEGRVWPSILGLLGMTMIGTASLWRAYRSTIAPYQGQSSGRNHRPASKAGSLATASQPGVHFMERGLPGFSEPVSAIALAGLRSILRAPEAKMMLMTPLIMAPIFGSMLWRGGQTIPEFMRPLVATGGMAILLLGLIPMMGNLFGFDRDGFRVFVLSSAPRRDILLGKNLGLAPVALGLGAIVLPIVQYACPMRIDHFLSTFPQYCSMFLLFSIFTNLLSIYTPVSLTPGTLKPSNLKVSTLLLQAMLSILLFPLTQAVVLLPLGTEGLMRLLDWAPDVPICLILSLAELGAVLIIYHFSLKLLGDALLSREQRILESVTNRAA
jgi:ABC-2 type transport system permease protein